MKKTICLVLCLCTFVSVYAQENNDAGLWTTLNINKKLNKKFSVFITEELRLRDNFSRINLLYTDAGLEYRPAKLLRLSLSYRFTQSFDLDNVVSFRHRINFDLTLRKKFNPLIISYRHRLQAGVRNIYTSENGNQPEWYSRHKFTIKYDTERKLTPYVAAEFRYQIHNPRMVREDGLFHRNRYIAGLDYDLNAKSSIGLYYLVQKEYNREQPANLYIIGLEYSLNF